MPGQLRVESKDAQPAEVETCTAIKGLVGPGLSTFSTLKMSDYAGCQPQSDLIPSEGWHH